MTDHSTEYITHEAADADQGEGHGASRGKLFAAGGLCGLLLVGGGYFFLHGGSSNNAANTVAIPRGVPHKATSAVAKGASAKAKSASLKTKPVAKAAAPAKLPVATSATIGRDPFHALYVIPVAAPPAASTPATTTPASTTTTTSTTGTPGTVAYALTLSKVVTNPGGAQLYTFSIAGTSKTVLAAQRFGKYGELVALAYVKDAKGKITGAVIQVGDDEPVSVRIGEKISVL